MKAENMKIQIDYLFNGFLVAFKITYTSLVSDSHSIYVSPFIYETSDMAHDAAIIELSNKK
jgi:hypothetical protein